MKKDVEIHTPKTMIILFVVFTKNNDFVGVFRGRTKMQEAMSEYMPVTYNAVRDAVNACNIGDFVIVSGFKIYKTLQNFVNPKLALNL